MTADFGNTALDRYIVGQYAHWAGDYEYAQRCYATAASRDVTEVVHRTKREPMDSRIEDLASLDDLLAFVADKRERRIAEKRHLFDSLVGSLPTDSRDLVPQPLILETPRLRGAVWQLGRREFEMLAYVTAVKHSKPVLERVKKISGDKRGNERGRRVKAAVSPEDGLHFTPVYEWEESGNPFLTVMVTGLMFIEVGAFWSKRNLPKSFDPIKERFQQVLDELSK